MRKAIFTSAALAVTATSAMADEYLVTLPAPLQDVSDGLYASVKVTKLDAFEQRGVHYVVLDAPSEVHVETFFSVYGTWPLAMSAIEEGWETYSALPLEQKLLKAAPMHCRFCIG